MKAGNRSVVAFGMNQVNTAVSSEFTLWLNQNFFPWGCFYSFSREDVGRSAASSQVSITAHSPLGLQQPLSSQTPTQPHTEHYLDLPKYTVKNMGYSQEACMIWRKPGTCDNINMAITKWLEWTNTYQNRLFSLPLPQAAFLQSNLTNLIPISLSASEGYLRLQMIG